MTPEQITNNLNSIAGMFDVEQDIATLTNLAEIINTVKERYFKKILSNEWPHAADPQQVCAANSEEDKVIRASAIFSLFLATKIHNGQKNINEINILDFGCGEGHLTKQISNSGVTAVGYDIKEQWSGQPSDTLSFTTNLEEAKKRGPYDLIVMYDVLDHAENYTPTQLLIQAREMLLPRTLTSPLVGNIILRCHPWCGRHGNHLWSLNKAFAHLIFTEEHLEKMGHTGIHTLKITNPSETYAEWIKSADLKVIWEHTTNQSISPLFRDNPNIKRCLEQWYGDNVRYDQMEQVWRDFCLEPICPLCRH